MDDLDTLVRRVDEDRWLATRFAPEVVRKRLVALYAVNYEIAHVREAVREPALIQIRLAWWREAIEAICAGRGAREHPALIAYARHAERLSPSPWIELIEARSEETDAFASLDAADAYFERTAGVVLTLALNACAGAPAEASALVRSAALAWGYQGYLRAAPLRARLPGDDHEILARARAAYAVTRESARGLAPDLFPAFGYVALAPAYLRAIKRGRFARPLLLRQLSLVAAAATGRV